MLSNKSGRSLIGMKKKTETPHNKSKEKEKISIGNTAGNTQIKSAPLDRFVFGRKC